MAERPILFSAPMVRAILDGRKTQTRRIVKPQPPSEARDAGYGWSSDAGSKLNGEWWWTDSPDLMEASIVGDSFRCPYGQPGDRLWVRETFYCDHVFYPNGTPASVYWEGNKPRSAHSEAQMAEQHANMLAEMYYRADGEPEWEAASSTPWRPSIHMPRWASRITLEVTSVGVERLHTISESDAEAEGAEFATGDGTPGDGLMQCHTRGFVPCYRDLWDQINGAGAWDKNPWVWVIEFKRSSANG